MSLPVPGDYFIVNSVSSYNGNLLAATYDGNNSVVRVVDLLNLPTQVWTIGNFNNGIEQYISPAISLDLQAGMGDGVVEVFPKPDTAYTWYIREVEGLYVIQDGSSIYFWGLGTPIEETPVTFSVGTGSEEQDWQLIATSG